MGKLGASVWAAACTLLCIVALGLDGRAGMMDIGGHLAAFGAVLAGCMFVQRVLRG